MGRSTSTTDGILTGKPVRIPKALRDELEAAVQAHLTAVEKLTAVLDRADGDENSEPSLGSITYGLPAHRQDCEADVVDEPHDEVDEGNGEPSLAHTNDLNQETAQKHLGILPISNARTWVTGSEDLEVEHDGREPSLGSVEPNFAGYYAHSFSQARWGAAATDDRENDGDDLEPDADGEP
jgi:hypothetical protein